MTKTHAAKIDALNRLAASGDQTQLQPLISHSGVVEGLLLYPLVDDPLDVDLMVKGQRLRVRTIDLATGWPDIPYSDA